MDNSKQIFAALTKANVMAYGSLVAIVVLIILRIVPTGFTAGGVLFTVLLFPYVVLLFIFAVSSSILLPVFLFKFKRRTGFDIFLSVIFIIISAAYVTFVLNMFGIGDLRWLF